MLSKMKTVNERDTIPNIYGHVSGCEVGTTFRRRRDFNYIHTSKDAIACGPEGPFSILMLNNKNIQDNGHTITVSTGEVQLCCDDVDPIPEGPFNQTLMTGLRSQLPVRVIRSSFVGSVFAPKTGFRYDGLYRLRDYTTTNIGDSQISFKFVLARIQCQLAVPWEDETSVNPTRFSQVSESLEIIKEPQILHSVEGDIDSYVAIEGFRLDESKYGTLDSSNIKVEDADVLNVNVKKEPAVTVNGEAAEAVKRESDHMADDPENDDDLSAGRIGNEDLIILGTVRGAHPEFESQAADRTPGNNGIPNEFVQCKTENNFGNNCIAMAKNEVEIDENSFVKTEMNPKSPIIKNTGDRDITVLYNGPILDEEVGGSSLRAKFKEIKIVDESKPMESSELPHSGHSSPEPVLNHYTSSAIQQNTIVKSSSEIRLTTPGCNKSTVFHVIAALDKLFGPKQIVVASKYIELLSATLNGNNEARVSSIIPLRPSTQKAVQDHRGDNIISGISTLDFDGDEFFVDNVQDSIMLDEAAAQQAAVQRDWWLVETEDNCMMLEPKPSLMMSLPSYSSPQTVKEVPLRPPSPVIVENNRSPTSQQHISPVQAVQPNISPSPTKKETRSLLSKRPLSPPQSLLEACSPSAPQRPYSPISAENNISLTSQLPLSPAQPTRKSRGLSFKQASSPITLENNNALTSQQPLSPALPIRKTRRLSSRHPHLPSSVENNSTLTSQTPLLPPRPIRKTRSLSSKRPYSPPKTLEEAYGPSTSQQAHSPIIVENNSSPALNQHLSPPRALRKTRRSSYKQRLSNCPSTTHQLRTPAAILEPSTSSSVRQQDLPCQTKVEASSFTTPEHNSPLRSTPVSSIYRNLRSSTKKLRKKECTKCLPPVNLLEGILGKNLELFRTFYSQHFCHCSYNEKSNVYDKMHNYILKLSKKNPKYLTAILAYLLYGQFKNKKRDIPSTFNLLCQNYLNDKKSEKNVRKVNKCMCSASTSSQMKSQSDVTSTSASPIFPLSLNIPYRRGKKRKCDKNIYQENKSLFDSFNTDSDQPNNSIDVSLSNSVAPNLLFVPTPDMVVEYSESPEFHGFYPSEIPTSENFINIWFESISSIFPSMTVFQGFDCPSKEISIVKSKAYDRWFDSNFSYQCT